MRFVPSLLFGISSSLDALLVGISLGLRRVCVRLWQNLFISLVTVLGTCLCIGFGELLAPLLPPVIASCVGSLILIGSGIYYIVRWLPNARRKTIPQIKKEPENADEIAPTLRAGELIALSLSLSANNMGMGLAASLGELSLRYTAFATALFSVALLFIGNQLGKSRFLLFIGSLADPLSGALLIGLGILQLF